jgi:hypothetical protein
LVLEGLVVTGAYSGGTEKQETWTPENITGYDSTAPGTKTLTVTLGSKTAAFDVTVGGEGLYRKSSNGWEAVELGSFTLADAMSWLGSNLNNNPTYTILLESNQSLAGNAASLSGTATIILRGLNSERIIQLTGTGSLFTITGSTLQLDENIALSGVNGNDASLLGIWMGGKLIMNEGSKITSNINTADSGGAITTWGSTIVMNGGEISGNSVTGSSACGGGVYFNEGTFTMNGGKISGNSAAGGYGGGLYLTDYGTFILKGGEIGANYAAYGGGVCVKGSYGGANMSFEKTGGTIYGSGTDANANTATTSGAAVYLGSTKKFGSTAATGTKLYAATNQSGAWTYDGGGETIGDTSDTWED